MPDRQPPKFRLGDRVFVRSPDYPNGHYGTVTAVVDMKNGQHTYNASLDGFPERIGGSGPYPEPWLTPAQPV